MNTAAKHIRRFPPWTTACFIAAVVLSFATTASNAQDRPLLSTSEPFGAEDFGAERHVPSIPEPLVFDLVRGLGAFKGEFEMNVLAEFPIRSSDEEPAGRFDPFGLTPSSEDRDEIEWAPEIEYAIADGLAIEFELPFEGQRLEAYKAAVQYTFGTAMNDQFIHGTQVIVEPHVDFEVWEMTYLYLAGYEFDRTWSMLGMVGLRHVEVEGEGNEAVDGLFNLSLFADITPHATLGFETNLVFGEQERTSVLLIPQVDYEITDQIQIQAGIGAGFSDEGTESLAIVRAIYSR